MADVATKEDKCIRALAGPRKATEMSHRMTWRVQEIERAIPKVVDCRELADAERIWTVKGYLPEGPVTCGVSQGNSCAASAGEKAE